MNGFGLFGEYFGNWVEITGEEDRSSVEEEMGKVWREGDGRYT
jgi:hypothetical protein